MHHQMVKSGVVISGGYRFIGIFIGGIYEINVIKTGEYVSYLLKLHIGLASPELFLSDIALFLLQIYLKN